MLIFEESLKTTIKKLTSEGKDESPNGQHFAEQNRHRMTIMNNEHG